MAENTHYLEKYHLLCCLRRYLESKLCYFSRLKYKQLCFIVISGWLWKIAKAEMQNRSFYHFLHIDLEIKLEKKDYFTFMCDARSH